MRSAACALFSLATVLLAAGCRSVAPVESMPDRVVPYPMLFLHGFGSSAAMWEMDGTVAYFETRGLRYGGRLRADGRRGAPAALRGKDLFTVGFADPYGDVDVWAGELEQVIRRALEFTGARKVILVAHSAGGLAARRYLVDHLDDHHVHALVTVASPHGGTELAFLADLKVLVEARPELLVFRPLVKKLEEAAGFPLNARILSQLHPVERNDWLQALDRANHPLDVRYVALVVEHGRELDVWQDLDADLRRLRSEPANSTLVNRLMQRLLDAVNAEDWHSGDGVILAERQRLSRVSDFRSRKIPVEEIPVYSRTHQEASKLHFEMLSAVSGVPSVARVAAKRGFLSRKGRLQIDYEHEFGSVVGVQIQAGGVESGLVRPLAFDGPSLVDVGAGTVSRIAVGPLPMSELRNLNLALTPPESTDVYAFPVVSRKEVVVDSPKAEGSGARARLRLRRVGGIPPDADRSLVPGWAGADVQVVVSSADGPIYRTEVIEDVPGDTISLTAPPVDLGVDPLRTRLSVQVWDVDLLGNTLLGVAVLQPGEWPRGEARLQTDTAVFIDVRLDWFSRPALHPEPPVRW